MRASYSTLERAANVAIIITCVAIVTLLYLKFIRSPPAQVETRVDVGHLVELLPRELYNETETTLVFLLQSRCPFCTESMPFYRRLLGQWAGEKAVRFVVMTPESLDVMGAYLRSHGFLAKNVVQARAGELAGATTPTLILLAHGGLRKVWVGQLDASRENEVTEALTVNVQR